MNSPHASPLAAEELPPKILPPVLKRFDLVTIYFAIIFGSYGAAQMASQGWAGIPMLLLAAVTFLLPCALASYELGTLFPSEGGIYVWAYKTLGPIHGFIAGWLSWIPIFLLLPLNAAVIASHLQYILGQDWSLPLQLAVQIGFVWILFAVSSSRLRTSQNIVNAMFFVAIITSILAIIAGLWMQQPGTPIDQEIFSFDLRKYGSLYSAAVLWLLGAEVPFNMGAEFASSHKTTGRTMLTWGTLALLAAYTFGISGVLLTTPVELINQTTGVAQAVATLSPVLGKVVALCICLAVFAQATSTMNAYSRLLFISGLEKKAPALMAKVSIERRTPWPAMLVQTIGATIVICIFVTQTQLTVTYNLYLAALVAVWCASLFYIYSGIIIARKRYAYLYTERDEHVWRIPGKHVGPWLCAMIGSVFNTLAIYYVFAKPWTSDITSGPWRTWLSVSCLTVFSAGLAVYHYYHRKDPLMNGPADAR